MPTINMDYGNANFTELFSDYLKSYSLPSTLDVMPEDDSGISFKDRFIQRNYYKEIGSETEELFTMHLAIKCQECVNRYLWKINEYIDTRDNFMSRVEKLNESITDTYGGSDVDTNKGTRIYQDSGTDSNDETGTRTTLNSNSDVETQEQYYNPLNSSSNNLVNKNTNTTAYGKQTTETPAIKNAITYGKTTTETPDLTNTKKYGKTITTSGYREHLMYFAKSYPELMEMTLKIENVYEEALEYLDVLFMGVL